METDQDKEIRLLKKALRALAGQCWVRCPGIRAFRGPVACRHSTCEECWIEWALEEANKC
jgi:hypothetical protein